MDCKSVDDLSILSRESIIQKYHGLHGCYSELKVSEQRQLQEIHQLRRELQTASASSEHLSSELEIINTEHAKEIEAIHQKHREELHAYKDRLMQCKNDLELVESARDNLEAMINDLRKEGSEEKEIVPVTPTDNNQSIYVEKITELEVENDELAEAVESLKAELTEALKANLQLENEIEDLKDRLRCAEENLNTKRDELEEKNEMYETAQERVIELSGELNAIRTESDAAADKRGNSLFAEVDDQRQKMRALLVAQKAHYIEMKNQLENREQEIRKLKRENAAMYKEMEVCSHIFLNAEQHHTEKLNERIAELMKESEAINKKLAFTEECLNAMTKKNDVKWLDPMLALCKNESNDLKDKLYRCSLQKVEIAGTLRQSEEEAARWRFEALKSRCIIADRESLLEDHKIPFSAISDIDRRVRKIDNENLSPYIACRPSMLGFKRRSLDRRSVNRVQSPMPVDSLSDKMVIGTEASSKPINANCNSDTDHIKGTENLFKKPSPPDANFLSVVDTAAPNECKIEVKLEPKQNAVTAESDKPKQTKIAGKSLSTPSRNFSGVTMRRKMNLSTPTVPRNNFKSPGTFLSSSQIRPKIISVPTSAGILKPSSTPNIPSAGKKVKFDNGSSMAKKVPERSDGKLEKVDSGVPKTAIKKRIFISSTKSAK